MKNQKGGEQNEKKTTYYKKGYSIYENKKLNISVYNDNGLLEFDIDGYLTKDCFEFVICLNSLSIEDSDDIWNIEISKNKYYINPNNILYLLTGGEKYWKSNYYLYSWTEISSFYEHHYSEEIINIVQLSNTLRDIKTNFNMKLSIPRLYEFSIRNRIIN